jgi:hypothetical protein
VRAVKYFFSLDYEVNSLVISCLVHICEGVYVVVLEMIVASENQTDKEGYWIRELMSLALEPRRKNELNDVGELEALANNMKQVYYQDCKNGK